MKTFETLFDLVEAKKTNILISGANASGKIRLGCAIASMLHKLGYTVIAIDVSGAWKHNLKGYFTNDFIIVRLQVYEV